MTIKQAVLRCLPDDQLLAQMLASRNILILRRIDNKENHTIVRADDLGKPFEPNMNIVFGLPLHLR